jgi:four helix bundle protein
VIEKFEDIIAWKKARILNKKLFEIVKEEPFSKDYSLKNQMCSAIDSVMLNITEGFERRSRKEFLNFLNIANGSIGEVKCGLYIAHDRDYIQEDELDKLKENCEEISKMIKGLIKYLKNSKKSKENDPDVIDS